MKNKHEDKEIEGDDTYKIENIEEMKIKPPEYIPFLFSGQSLQYIAKMFENEKIPSVGDRVEVVCYERSFEEGQFKIKCKWRVIKKRWWWLW